MTCAWQSAFVFVQVQVHRLSYTHHQAHLYLIRWVSYHSSVDLFYNPSSVFDTKRFAYVFVRGLDRCVNQSLALSSIKWTMSYHFYAQLQGSSVSWLDMTTGSPPSGLFSIPVFQVGAFPLFQISYLTHLSFFVLFFCNIYSPHLYFCIDTKPGFLVCIRYDEIGLPTAFTKSLPMCSEGIFWKTRQW